MNSSMLRSAAQVKCDLAGDPHSGTRAAKAAMQRATWGRTGRIADATGLSQRTVETWGNPADPQRSPLQQLEIVMCEALAAGAVFGDATAPLAYLNARFLNPAEQLAGAESMESAISEALEAATNSIAYAIRANADRKWTRVECAKFEVKAQAAITQIHRAVREAQAAVDGPKPMRGARWSGEDK